MEALHEVTKKVRAGKVLSDSATKPYGGKIVHVGHSYGSETIFTLAAYYPTSSDGIILTGFR
jgi:pimeloyl-ACP methyl ester carboxylesterase